MYFLESPHDKAEMKKYVRNKINIIKIDIILLSVTNLNKGGKTKGGRKKKHT